MSKDKPPVGPAKLGSAGMVGDRSPIVAGHCGCCGEAYAPENPKIGFLELCEMCNARCTGHDVCLRFRCCCGGCGTGNDAHKAGECKDRAATLFGILGQAVIEVCASCCAELAMRIVKGA